MKTSKFEQKFALKIYAAAAESGLIDDDDFLPSPTHFLEIENLTLLANALISCKMFEEDTPQLQNILDNYASFVKFKIKLNRLLYNEK